jgi:hypothetical protein
MEAAGVSEVDVAVRKITGHHTRRTENNTGCRSCPIAGFLLSVGFLLRFRYVDNAPDMAIADELLAVTCLHGSRSDGCGT